MDNIIPFKVPKKSKPKKQPKQHPTIMDEVMRILEGKPRVPPSSNADTDAVNEPNIPKE